MGNKRADHVIPNALLDLFSFLTREKTETTRCRVLDSLDGIYLKPELSMLDSVFLSQSINLSTIHTYTTCVPVRLLCKGLKSLTVRELRDGPVVTRFTLPTSVSLCSWSSHLP